MIFRRVKAHIEKENWFAVFIDFLIVVVGVFIGIQVANWNEGQQNRTEEKELLLRLHQEVRDLNIIHHKEKLDYEARGKVLENLNPVLFSQQAIRPLSELECLRIVGSHVYRKPSDNLPVLDELLTTGRFDIFKDQAIKQKLSKYLLFRERQRGNHNERTNELFRLYSLHPDLISASLETKDNNSDGFEFLTGDKYQWAMKCDVEKMRNNAKFLNEYFDNVARTSNVIQAYRERELQLKELEKTLAVKLGLTSNGETS